MDKHQVTPGEILPARELYADTLLEAGDHADALAQYRHVLKTSPNRLNALIGAANSAKRSGDADLAEHYSAAIRQQTRAGNAQRVGLQSSIM